MENSKLFKQVVLDYVTGGSETVWIPRQFAVKNKNLVIGNLLTGKQAVVRDVYDLALTESLIKSKAKFESITC